MRIRHLALKTITLLILVVSCLSCERPESKIKEIKSPVIAYSSTDSVIIPPKPESKENKSRSYYF